MLVIFAEIRFFSSSDELAALRGTVFYIKEEMSQIEIHLNQFNTTNKWASSNHKSVIVTVFVTLYHYSVIVTIDQYKVHDAAITHFL